MAFGNATKGYVRSHAGGGGGGGTKDYESLLNKPSINGVELLGDKSIGSLNGNIQVKLSDIANTNLNNVQNAQTLLYNALSQKWENGNVPAGFNMNNVTTDALDSTKGIDITQYSAISFTYKDTAVPAQTVASGLYLISDLSDGERLLQSTTNNYCAYDVHISNGKLYLTKSPDGTPMNILNVYAY